MKTVATALGFAALLASSVAMADEEKFKAADTSGDGALSMEEAVAAMPNTTEESFKAADADQDGSLNLDEFSAAVAAGTLG
jgi:Ca2+-binding EF-hand superfamily protein